MNDSKETFCLYSVLLSDKFILSCEGRQARLTLKFHTRWSTQCKIFAHFKPRFQNLKKKNSYDKIYKGNVQFFIQDINISRVVDSVLSHADIHGPVLIVATCYDLYDPITLKQSDSLGGDANSETQMNSLNLLFATAELIFGDKNSCWKPIIN